MIHFAIEQVNILFSIQRVSSFKKKIEYKKEIGIKSNLLRYFNNHSMAVEQVYSNRCYDSCYCYCYDC